MGIAVCFGELAAAVVIAKPEITGST